MRDLELLRRYSQDGSQEAFTELMSRHVDAVYSAALRQVRSPDLAREVAQSVFLDLVRRAGELRTDGHLLSWLYLVARRTSIDIIRREARRAQREQEAMEGAALSQASGEWSRVAPLFDAAVCSLSQADREAVLLRFVEKKPFCEVAQALGLSEDAAKKRVSRAVDRLREFLARRGVTTSATLLTAEMAPNAVQGAPSGLAAAISGTIALARPFAQHAALYQSAHSLAMTLSQKVTVALFAAAALAGGLYQDQVIRREKRQLAAFEQQLGADRDQIRRLSKDRSDLTASLASASRANEQLKLAAGGADDPTEKTLKAWLVRVSQLRQRFEEHPDQKIPDLKFMTDQDWLNAARQGLDSDKDYRRALAAMRNAAWSHSVSYVVQPALQKYANANGGAYPTDVSQLQPYLDNPDDAPILQEFEVVPQFAVNVHVGEKTVLTQRTQIDPENDDSFVIGTHGMGSVGPVSDPNETSIVPLVDAYAAANNGALPTDPSQLLPYAATPEQQRGIQNAIARSRPKPR